MKCAVTSYSFFHQLQAGKETQLSIIPLAKQLGFEGIEFTDLTPPKGTSAQAYAVLLREKAAECGLEIVAYTVSANLLAADLKAEIGRVCRKVDIAETLGAKLLRHDLFFTLPDGAPRYAGFATYLPTVANACREITRYAAQKGMRTMTENHGFLCQDADRMEAVVQTVADENFGLLLDIGNFLCADNDPAYAVGRLAPYAFHVHAKDFIKYPHIPVEGKRMFTTRGGMLLRGTYVGNGCVPLIPCMRALKKAGYDGYVTVEFEGTEPVETAVAAGLANLRQSLEAI